MTGLGIVESQCHGLGIYQKPMDPEGLSIADGGMRFNGVLGEATWFAFDFAFDFLPEGHHVQRRSIAPFHETSKFFKEEMLAVVLENLLAPPLILLNDLHHHCCLPHTKGHQNGLGVRSCSASD